MTAPVPLPPLTAVLLVPRRAAIDAFVGVGWRAFAGATPLLDAERRRLLNLDLTDPDVALVRDGDLAAVAHVETDLEGMVTHVEVVGAAPEDPHRVAVALAGAKLGAPRMGGGADAREWVWGPESGATFEVNGEPARLWICAERAYGDRLWAVATVVRRG